jgi:iron(III) transport system permease protein
LDNQIDAVMRDLFGISTGLLISGTMAILVFAYLARFMALSFGAVSASFGRVTRNMDGAARTLGHGGWSTLFRVHIPMIRGGVLTAVLMVFVEVMKELPATLILRPFDFNTLATRVYEFASDEQFEEIGIWALSIAAAGIIPVILLSVSIRHSRPGHPTDA